MTREEERNMITHEIAWQHTKHYDPLLSKESWCEMAAREAIDWADKHPRKGLVDIDKTCEWLLKNIHNYLHVTGGGYWFDGGVVLDLKKAMEE